VALDGQFAWPLTAFAIAMLALWTGPASYRRRTSLSAAGATPPPAPRPYGRPRPRTYRAARNTRRG
jgi:hypothetical protein